MFIFIHTQAFFSLKFLDVKAFTRPEQERISGADDLNWEHLEVGLNTVAGKAKVSTNRFQGVFVASLGRCTKMAAETPGERRSLSLTRDSNVGRCQSRALSTVFLAENQIHPRILTRNVLCQCDSFTCHWAGI